MLKSITSSPDENTFQARFTQKDIDRFWSHVDRSGDCWLWQAYRSSLGYGRFTLPGTGTTYSHRMAWEIERGPIPQGLNVLHSCDNPSCVRPDHLYLGSQKKNLKDAVDRGRWATRQRALTWAEVCEIRHRHEVKGESQIDLAAEYGIALGYCNRICRYLVRQTPSIRAGDLDAAIQLAAERGGSIDEIAAAFRISRNAVWRRLKTHH